MYTLDSSLQSYTLPSFNPRSQGSSSNPYLACLIDPANNAVRIPDEYSNQTALYSSRTFYDVYGNTAVGTSAANVGKFSFMIRPVMGAQAPPPALAQICHFNPNSVWPVAGDFSNPALFIADSDPNLTTLIGTLGTNGLVREIRPVAMSAWFQYTAPTLTLGGHVACALTDGNVHNFFPTSAASMAGLPLEEYRALSTLPNSYNGKIVDGCYGFYKPFDAEDINFQNAHQPYDSMTDYGVSHTYPSIIISGQVMSTTGTYSGVIGRIQVDIIFEYVTFSRIVQSLPSPVDPPLLWNARQALQNLRTCMANEEHESFFKKVLNGAKLLLNKVAPLAGTTLGGFVGGPAGAAIGNSIGRAVSRVTAPRSIKQSKPKQKQKQSNVKKNKSLRKIKA